MLHQSVNQINPLEMYTVASIYVKYVSPSTILTMFQMQLTVWYMVYNLPSYIMKLGVDISLYIRQYCQEYNMTEIGK